MSGSYTINPSGSGSRNFASFTAAVNNLNANGVNGAVVFNVSNGTYSEKITLNYVSGSSSTNTVTFKGTDSSRTILSYNTAQYEAVVTVKAANFFRFSNMTIKANDNLYGYGIHITAGASNTVISNCILQTGSSTAQVDCIPLTVSGVTYSTSGDNGDNVTVRNCIIDGGYYGINMRGASTSVLSEDLIISNCTFENQRYMNVYAENVEDVEILNCELDNPLLFYGYNVYLSACSGGEISNNFIRPGRYGIYAYLQNYYNRSDSTIIANNEISDFNDGSYNVGIYSNASYKLSMYHNTILVDGSVSSNSFPAVYLSAPLNHRMLNNSIKSKGSSYALFMGPGSFGNTVIDYNNYHGGNGGFIYWQGTDYNNLSTLQSANSTQNQNCKQEDPGYSGNRNLVPVNPGLNNCAKLGVASTDLAGNSRPKNPDLIPDIGAYEYYVSPYDIDVINIYDPIIAKSGNNLVSAVLKNNGSAAFSDTIYIHYKVGTGSWVKDTAIFNNFAIGATDTFTFTKPWNVTQSGTYQACVALNPVVNGDPDSLVGDTFCNYKCLGQSGTYTVDPSGNGDFTTLSAAVSALDCGISGPIKFIVKDGTYAEKISINEVIGASSTNTITFEGNDKDKVILRYNGSGSTPANIELKGTDYITFKNFTIENKGNSAACGFWLRDECKYVNIENCYIELDSNTRAVSSIIGILVANTYSGGTTVIAGNGSNNISVKNCSILGGGYGIRMNGLSTTNTLDNNRIENNILRSQYYSAIHVAYVGRSVFRKNQLLDSRFQSNYAMNVYYCNRDTIESNIIKRAGRFGMYIYLENYYDRNGFSLVSNNMVSDFIDPTYQSGIFSYLNYNTNFYHNSVWITGTYNNYYYTPLCVAYSNNCNVKNNALKAENGSMAFSLYYGTINITAVNNNCYYSEAPAKFNHDGLIFADLATWKAVKANQNSNSIEGDPGFTSEQDLHVTGDQLNNKGASNLGVLTDIDGQSRPLSPDKKVDIGADEFYVSPWDVDLISLDEPIVPVLGNNPVKITLKNAGKQDLSNDTVVVSYFVDNGTPVTDTVIIASLATNDTIQYTFNTPWNVSSNKQYQLCATLDTVFKADPDTLTIQQKCRTMCPGASGNYTIDKSGNGDFKSFRAAINSLQCGINGNVTFTVKNGTYNERVVLEEINGAGANARVKFIGESRSGV
ncbi:MAG: right-handed parallel beta-helix repeat-containing protein, partial [Bacteroidetes bacterium]|nr:right-handed parallel beta-helix repeat-containing protein [Bacteroidota bacterium]